MYKNAAGKVLALLQCRFKPWNKFTQMLCLLWNPL